VNKKNLTVLQNNDHGPINCNTQTNLYRSALTILDLPIITDQYWQFWIYQSLQISTDSSRSTNHYRSALTILDLLIITDQHWQF